VNKEELIQALQQADQSTILEALQIAGVLPPELAEMLGGTDQVIQDVSLPEPADGLESWNTRDVKVRPHKRGPIMNKAAIQHDPEQARAGVRMPKGPEVGPPETWGGGDGTAGEGVFA
jgi:hypothetical protein